MEKVDVVKLLSDSPSAHGVFDDTPTRTSREVMCKVRSVGMNESYIAKSQGLNPSYQFELALAEDYEGEKLLKYNNVLYTIIRTYINGDGIELTAERADADV